MLKWNGSGFMPGIPARDLTDDEVKQYGGERFLLDTGIYEKPKDDKKMKVEVKDGRN